MRYPTQVQNQIEIQKASVRDIVGASEVELLELVDGRVTRSD